MNTYQVKVQRKAEATLEAILAIRAQTREQAEQFAVGMAEEGELPFDVASYDLTAFEGSSEVILEGNLAGSEGK